MVPGPQPTSSSRIPGVRCGQQVAGRVLRRTPSVRAQHRLVVPVRVDVRHPVRLSLRRAAHQAAAHRVRPGCVPTWDPPRPAFGADSTGSRRAFAPTRPGRDVRSRRLDRVETCVRADSTGSRRAFAPTRRGRLRRRPGSRRRAARPSAARARPRTRSCPGRSSWSAGPPPSSPIAWYVAATTSAQYVVSTGAGRRRRPRSHRPASAAVAGNGVPSIRAIVRQQRRPPSSASTVEVELPQPGPLLVALRPLLDGVPQVVQLDAAVVRARSTRRAARGRARRATSAAAGRRAPRPCRRG